MDLSPQGEHWAMRIKPKLPAVRSIVWLGLRVVIPIDSQTAPMTAFAKKNRIKMQ
jgi:hypothetical protein